MNCDITTKTFRLLTGMVVFIFLLALPFSSAYAGSDAAEVSVDISPKVVRVGDIITMKVYINHSEDYSLYLPPSINLAPFEIIDTKAETIKKADEIFSFATFKLALYQTGSFTVPKINLLLKNEKERIEVMTPQFLIEVTSLLKAQNNALIPINPPVDVRQSYLKYLMYLWAISFCVIVASLLYFRKRRKAKRHRPVKAKRKTDPKLASLAMLEKIFAHNNIQTMSDKEICENVSFTVKYFIKERFSVDSLEMTTSELLESLEDIGASKKCLNASYRLLSNCDLVKFAGIPLKNSIDTIHDYAMEVVKT